MARVADRSADFEQAQGRLYWCQNDRCLWVGRQIEATGTLWFLKCPRCGLRVVKYIPATKPKSRVAVAKPVG